MSNLSHIHSRTIRIVWGLIGLLVFISVHRNLKQSNVCKFKPFHKTSGDIYPHKNWNMEDELMGSNFTCHCVSTIAMSRTRNSSIVSPGTRTHAFYEDTPPRPPWMLTQLPHSQTTPQPTQKPPLFTTSGHTSCIRSCKMAGSHCNPLSSTLIMHAWLLAEVFGGGNLQGWWFHCGHQV